MPNMNFKGHPGVSSFRFFAFLVYSIMDLVSPISIENPLGFSRSIAK